LLKLNSCI